MLYVLFQHAWYSYSLPTFAFIYSCLQSLTYSATSESLLYESVTMDETHIALEHLTGAVLYQETPRADASHSDDGPFGRCFTSARSMPSQASTLDASAHALSSPFAVACMQLD
jgi:hypothetical protein